MTSESFINQNEQLMKLTARVGVLETDVEDLDAILNGENSILQKFIVLQINHTLKLYDLIYELATPNNTKDLMHASESSKLNLEEGIKEIFPSDESV